MGVDVAGKAEFERWKVDDAQSAVSDNFVRLNMRKRFKGSTGRAKKRPAYLRARNGNLLDEATGDKSTGIAPLVNASGSQQRKKEKPLFADDGVDFIEECLEALAKAEKMLDLSETGTSETTTPAEKLKPSEPPRCHHALVCQDLVVKKKNKNHGRRFFACPLGYDEGRCDFFLWEDDHTPLALQTLFTASSLSSTGESAAEAESIACVPLDLEATEEEQSEALLTNLRLVFGHAEFRPGQQWAISRVLRRQNTLLVLPTGAGKSLCYQFPALFLPGITLVISPLISLMNDQYESLPAPLKARAICLSGSSGSESGSSKARHAAFVRDLLADKLSLVFLSPEKALEAKEKVRTGFARGKVRVVVATIAFGMGIDKKNVRAVVHFHMPSSVEGYVQQVAGFLDISPSRPASKTDGPCFPKRERHLDLKAATIETFLTLLALETQRSRSSDQTDARPGLRVTLQPLSMSRCTLRLLDTQARKLAPQSCVKILLEAAQRKGEPNARVTHRKDGYLSSWIVEFHLHEMAQWYARTISTRSNDEHPVYLLVTSDAQQEGESNATAIAAATSERRMLQELRAAQQAGQIQLFSLSHPAFQLQLTWGADANLESKTKAVDRWTSLLYSKHKHLEARQLARLAHLHGALHAAAIPAPSTASLKTDSDEDDSECLEEKAQALETKLMHYFDDDDDIAGANGVGDVGDDDRLLQKLLRPLTSDLIECIERDARDLVQLRLGRGGVEPMMEVSEAGEGDEEPECNQWTSYAVAKVFHGLTTPRFPTRQWRDHVCWRRYADVAFERIVQIAHKVLLEDQAESTAERSIAHDVANTRTPTT
ncbi:hypothetical protein BBJ29_006335 [Phytophthora kernoviae]|uniref:DNA 3'-5' helicase n=1 Tax=Phytophthora kernoviae TaxID=325452 RepID=A0A421GAI8_9STRA|nr:hypothetical protein BBJ29_006335 [Phytophthora kernoviae]